MIITFISNYFFHSFQSYLQNYICMKDIKNQEILQRDLQDILMVIKFTFIKKNSHKIQQEYYEFKKKDPLGRN